MFGRHGRRRVRRRWVALVVAAVLGVSGLFVVPGVGFAAQAVDEVHYTFTSVTSVANFTGPIL